jgi:hypothetical protein
MTKHPAPTLRDLYPNLTDDELREAEENLARYLELVLRIYKRLEAERSVVPRTIS